MGYTVELKTNRYGVWFVTDIVFATVDEAAEYAHELNTQWPELISEWQTLKTLKTPTHTWDMVAGITKIP